jgi:hypothetical protein
MLRSAREIHPIGCRVRDARRRAAVADNAIADRLRAIEPATRRCDGSSASQSWSFASGDGVEELQFEFHRLVIQDGHAVVITAVAVKQALYTSG